MRPDLLEELCFVEALEATLPKSQEDHTAWTRTIGFPANEFPHEWVLSSPPDHTPAGDFLFRHFTGRPSTPFRGDGPD